MQFVGRDNELELLRKQWRDCQFGKINVVVLEAESRMGKTRIVQEFYGWLNQFEDLQNYWPDTLPRGGDSLAVNPNFETPTEAVLPPWLWWGLRWTNPEARNQQDISCVAITASKHLEKHLAGLKDDIKRIEANKKALEGLAKSGLNLATAGTFEFANQVLQTGIEVSERIQDWLDIRGNKGASSEDSILDRDQKVKETELEVLLNLLVTMATTDKIILGGLPLILFLDDAHWADQESLVFLQRLIRELIRSKKKPAQLLIIATVWEREWKSQHAMPMTSQAHSKPQNFFEVLTTLQIEAKTKNISTINIVEHNLLPLKAGVETAIAHELPGLTETQNNLLIEKSGGSPGLLYELIIKLRDRNRHLFENSDPAKKLTQSGENAVKKMTVYFHELVEERMSYLSIAEGTLMRLASYIGLSYSRPFLKELSHYVKEYAVDFPQDSDVDSAIDRADMPLAIIQKVAEQLDEFRLPIYRDVLNKQLIEHEGLWKCLNEKIPNLLCEWVEEEKLQQMSPDERMVFLQFAQYELNARLKATPEKSIALALFKTLTAQIVEVVKTGRTAPMLVLFQQWFTLWQQAQENSLALSENAIIAVLECADMLSQHEARVNFCQDILDRRPILTPADPQFTEPSRVQLICLTSLINALGEQDKDTKVNSALSYAEIALSLSKHLLKTQEDSEQRLQDVSSILILVGKELAKNDKNKHEALKHFAESLSIRRRLLAELGDSKQRQLDLSVSLCWVGELLSKNDQQKTEALNHFEESLAICRRLLAEFGDSEQLLVRLTESLDRSGLLLAKNDKSKHEALKHFMESLSIRRRLLAEFGDSEQRLGRLSASLCLVSDLQAKNDKNKHEALKYSEESLGIRRRLLAEFGDSEKRMRDVSESLCLVGDLQAKNDKNKHEALKLFVESLSIRRRLLAEFGDNEKRMRDVSVSLSRVGGLMEQNDHQKTEALNHFEESLAICRRLLAEFGNSEQRMRDVGICYSKLVVFYTSTIDTETHCKAEALSHAIHGFVYAKKLAEIAPDSDGQDMVDWYQAAIKQLS